MLINGYKEEYMIYKTILIIVMTGCIARGLLVFDMGRSAIGTNTTASAICLVAAVIATGILYLAEHKVALLEKEEQE